VVLAGMLATSGAWAWYYQTTLAAMGQRVITQVSLWLWEIAQMLVAMLVQQPEFGVISKLMANPLQIAILLVSGSLLYLGGLLALRWLLTTPTSQVAYGPR
jgi:hypothetical protein